MLPRTRELGESGGIFRGISSSLSSSRLGKKMSYPTLSLKPRHIRKRSPQQRVSEISLQFKVNFQIMRDSASIFFVFKTALVLYCCCVTVSVSGLELQSSMEKQLDGNIQVRFGRFLVWTTTTTSTSFTVIYTQLLTTYRQVQGILI